jgi:hypothetical protein
MGYYSVGASVYHSKIDAVVAGTQHNIHPVWHFGDHVWKKQNWQHEPEINILELYKMRARQIRERYDYVIIFYSGGSDSHTLVEAFISAGCRIDEIQTVWSRKATKNFVLDPNITDARNIEAEFDLTTKHGLNWIKNVSPSTKITYLDISDAVLDHFNQFDGAEWLGNTKESLAPQIITRWSATREYTQLKQLDQGLRTTVVFGVDKPRVCIKDGKYHVYFLDSLVNCFNGGFDDSSYTNLTTEYFYWTTDFPEIVIKQSHMIRRWFEATPSLKFLLVWPNSDYSQRSTYEIIVRSIIYPEWDQRKFQCVKIKKSVYSEWDDWFFTTQQGTRAYNTWYQGVEYVQQNIDPKYLKYDLDRKLDGFVGMINGHFALD